MSPIIFLWGPSESSHGVYGKVLDKISFLMSSNCYLWFFNVSRSCEYKYALIRLWYTFLYVCICIIHMCVCVCDYLCLCVNHSHRDVHSMIAYPKKHPGEARQVAERSNLMVIPVLSEKLCVPPITLLKVMRTSGDLYLGFHLRKETEI